MLHGFRNCCLLSNSPREEILPISTVVQCSKEELSQPKKEEKQLSWSNSPVFLKHKMPVVEKEGGRREIVLAIESEVGSSLLLLVITFRTQNVQKSDIQSPLLKLCFSTQ